MANLILGETRTRSLRHRRAHAVVHEDGSLQVLAGARDVGLELVIVRLVARWRRQELAGSQTHRAVQGHPHQRISETPCPEVSGVLLVTALLWQRILPRTGTKKLDHFTIVKYKYFIIGIDKLFIGIAT